MIIPSTKYPAQTAIDLTNYPQGKARNVTATGDGSGTPLEKDWINDVWGFFQALVARAGITPSGVPETAVASDLLNAVQAREIAVFTFDGATHNAADNFVLTMTSQRGGFSVASNVVTVPRAGSYRLVICGALKSTLTTNPLPMKANITGTGLHLWGQRFSASASDVVGVALEAIVDVPNPSTFHIGLQSEITGLSFESTIYNSMILERVG